MIARTCTFLAFVMLVTAPAAARCDPSFETLTETSGSVNLDPFETSPFERTLRVSVRNTGADACRLGLSATDRTLGARLLTDSSIPYDVIWDNVQIANFDVPAPGKELSLSPGETREIYISILVRRPVFIRPQSTEAFFTLRLHDLDNANEVLAQQDARLPANVVATAQINIAGTSSTFGSSYGVDTIDFGTIEQGKSQTVFIQLRGNTSMRMTVQSANNGQMRHTVLKGAAGIPFTIGFAGATYQPTSTRAFGGLLASGAFGTNLPFTLKIGDFSDPPAGRYEDVITLSIEPE